MKRLQWQHAAADGDADDRTIRIMLAATFFLGLGQAFIETAANALFVAEIGAHNFSYVYLAAALLSLALCVAMTRGMRAATLQSLALTLLAVLVMGTLLLVSTLQIWPRSELFFALAVWNRLAKLLVMLIMAMMAAGVFNLKTRYYLFGSIGVVALLAQACGFLAAGGLTGQIVPSSFLWAAGVGFLAALLLFASRSSALSPSALAVFRRQLSLSLLRPGKGNRTALLFAGVLVISLISNYLISAEFYVQAGARTHDPNSLIRFLGLCFGITALSALAIRSTLTPLLLRRFGVGFGVALLPALLLLVTSLLLGRRILLGDTATFGLPALITLRVLDYIVRQSTFLPTIALIHQPLQQTTGATGRSHLDELVHPLALISAAILLLAVTAGGFISSGGVMAVLWVLALGWLAAALLLTNEYPRLLVTAFHQQSFDRARATTGALDANRPVDREAVHTLAHALNSNEEAVQIYAVQVLTKAAPEQLTPQLARLLDQPSPPVRRAALKAVVDLRTVALVPLLQRLVTTDPDITIRRDALTALAVLAPTTAIAMTAIHPEDRDPGIYATALAIRIDRGDPATRSAAIAQAHAMAESGTSQAIQFVADLLVQSSTLQDVDIIKRLLESPFLTAQKAALNAAQRADNPALDPIMVRTLGNANLRSQAQAVLVTAGNRIVPTVEEQLLDPDTPQAIRLALLDLCGALDDSRTTALLLAHINVPGDLVRSRALRALSMQQYHASSYMRPRLFSQIDEELAEAACLIRVADQISTDTTLPAGAQTLLQGALDKAWKTQRNNALQRASFLLNERLPSDAVTLLDELDEDRQDLSHQILLTLLPAELRLRLEPFIAEAPLHKRAATVRDLSRSVPQELSGALLFVQERADAGDNRWLGACALYAIGSLPPELRDERVAAALAHATIHEDPLLADTARSAQTQQTAAKLPDLSRATGVTVIEGRAMLSTIERVLFLRSVNLFSSVPDDVLTWVAQSMTEVYIPQRTRFITQGELGDGLFVVISGDTDILIEGKGKIAVRGPKSVLGEMGILTRQPRTASCVAATDIIALKLNRDDFLQLLTEIPQLALGIIDVLVQRLDDVSHRAAIS